ncbi:MAG: MoaD/ThiS family protein [Candidatus Nanoarchaeia archaeon]|nr:MoaD/ThiS family protein [Candidatus Nanoarchaeia archaeon]
MKVYIEKTGKTANAKAPSVAALLKKLNINPVTVLVVKNGALVTEDAKLAENDTVKILSVVSGG